MADFKICYPFMLGNEIVISSPAAFEVTPDNIGQVLAGINSTKWPADFARIAALPVAERPTACSIFYEANFWNNWLNQVVSNRIAAMMLDSGVNQGSGWAVKFAQTAAGLAESAVDGHFGPITLAAINSAPVANLVPAFIAARKARYEEIGGPSLPGWLVRAKKVPAFD